MRPHSTVGAPSPTTGTAPTLIGAPPPQSPALRSPYHFQDAEPSRVCSCCLADYWRADAEFEGVRLVPGLCPVCTAASQRQGGVR